MKLTSFAQLNALKRESQYETSFKYILKVMAPTLIYETEYKFHLSRKWRFDFAIPDKKVAIEIDGGQWLKGGGRHNKDSDREKMNAAAEYGWRVLRFSGDQILKDPHACVDILIRTLSFN